MIEELKKILNESATTFDSPYDKEYDNDIPKLWKTRRKVLKLSDINKLKKIRNQKREELAQDSTFIAPLYGPDMSGGEDMGGMPGGLGL